MLTKGFVNNLLDSISKTKSQLIVTTNETELLDLSKYRRDCFWFIERNENNESELFSLDQFKTRKDLKLSKAYLEGRFGALPYITESDLDKYEKITSYKYVILNK